MTDESQTHDGLTEDTTPKEEGFVSKVINAAKEAGEKIEEAVEAVAEKVEDVVENVAEKVGLKKADDDDDNDDDDDDDDRSPSSEVVASAPVTEEPAADTATEEPVAETGETKVLEPVAADAGAVATTAAVFEPTAEDSEENPRRLADLTPGMELEGRVTSTALYGVFVDIGVGRDGLVHISEMSDQRIDSPTDVVQIGDTVKVRVKSVDPDARRISLTMRSPRTEGGRRRQRRPEVDRDRLGEMKPGDLIEGTVNGIAPFGVFVDIGVGKDGLVHISELSENRVERAEDAVTVGESYTFRVLEVDAEGQRISLSLRRAQEGFQERPRARRRDVNLDAVMPGQILDGTVSGIAPFGAFVDLGVGRDGLVHISELSENRVGKVEDVVNVGDPVKVRVLEVDPSSKRISLSMRLEEPVGPISTSGSSRLDRDWTNPALRDEPREDRSARKPRRSDRPETRREPEVYSFGEEEEVEEIGNATLDDLLSKFGSDTTRRPGRKRYERETDEDLDESRESRARRDAIRRTLRDQDDY